MSSSSSASTSASSAPDAADVVTTSDARSSLSALLLSPREAAVPSSTPAIPFLWNDVIAACTSSNLSTTLQILSKFLRIFIEAADTTPTDITTNTKQIASRRNDITHIVEC